MTLNPVLTRRTALGLAAAAVAVTATACGSEEMICSGCVIRSQ